MNDQLKQTLTALSGGRESLDLTAARQNVGDWQQTLAGLPGGEVLAARLADLGAALEREDLEAVSALLPEVGKLTEKITPAAPLQDQTGLLRLAALLKGRSGQVGA